MSVAALVGLLLILNNKFDKYILLNGIFFLAFILVGLLFYYLLPYEGRLISSLYGWDLFFILRSNNTVGFIEANPNIITGLRGDFLFRNDIVCPL